MKPFLMMCVALATMVGCARPMYLVEDSFVGTRSVKTVLAPTAQQAVTLTSKQQQALYDYIVRICDTDSSGKEAACTDSTVMTNVIPHSLY